MLVHIKQALVAKVEQKEFTGRKGDIVSYTPITFLDDENNIVNATVLQDLKDKALALKPRTVVKLGLDITEETRETGTILRKKVVEIG